MALIEPRLLEGLQWQKQQFQTPLGKAMSSLDGDMQDILEKHLPPDEKVTLYNQVLQRYINFHEQRQSAARAPVPVTMVDSGSDDHHTKSADTSSAVDAIEQEVMESVPSRMKKKAQLLINRIKAHPELTWTDRGELMYKNQVVTNSNVADLVNDMLRRRKHFQPHGWQTFGQALKEMNVPQDLIGHRERWEWMQHAPLQHGVASPSPPPPPQPPLKTKRKRVVSTRVLRWSPY